MRSFLISLILLASSSSMAAINHCATYEGNSRFLKAIQVVAKHQGYDFAELCTDARLLAIEVQPNRLIKPDFGGTQIPAVRVDLHSGYQTCSYIVTDEDQAVAKAHCYSGF